MPKHPADTLAYRFDEWTPDGKTLVATHAFIGDWEVARAAWRALIRQKPHDRLTMRHGALVHAEQPWSDKFAKRA